MTFVPDKVSLSDLPPPNTRWTPARKALLMKGIFQGVISLEVAAERYSLSTDELWQWKHDFDKDGQRGLRATSAQMRNNRKVRRRT